MDDAKAMEAAAKLFELIDERAVTYKLGEFNIRRVGIDDVVDLVDVAKELLAWLETRNQ